MSFSFLILLNFVDFLCSIENKKYGNSFVNIVISVYGTFAELIDSKDGNAFSYQEMGLIVNIIYCGGIYFLICDCSGSATKQVSKGVQRTLLSMNLLKVDLDTKIEIDFFIVAMELNPAIVNLKGYVTLNREVLSSVCEIFILINFNHILNSNVIHQLNNNNNNCIHSIFSVNCHDCCLHFSFNSIQILIGTEQETRGDRNVISNILCVIINCNLIVIYNLILI